MRDLLNHPLVNRTREMLGGHRPLSAMSTNEVAVGLLVVMFIVVTLSWGWLSALAPGAIATIIVQVGYQRFRSRREQASLHVPDLAVVKEHHQ